MGAITHCSLFEIGLNSECFSGQWRIWLSFGDARAIRVKQITLSSGCQSLVLTTPVCSCLSINSFDNTSSNKINNNNNININNNNINKSIDIEINNSNNDNNHW